MQSLVGTARDKARSDDWIDALFGCFVKSLDVPNKRFGIGKRADSVDASR